MPHLFRQFCLCLLIFIFGAGQAVAFDIQVCPMNFNPAMTEQGGRHHNPGSSFGAMISIPLGPSDPGGRADTLNGQNLLNFTKQDAKDSAIVIMLFGVAIAAGALTVSASAN